MAGPASSSDKKQASLTSFFTPKTVNGLKPPTKTPRNGDEERTGAISLRKRPLQEASGSGNESANRRVSKRVKATSEDEDDLTTLAAKSPKPISSSDRTERYAYDAARSSARENGDEEEANEDAAVRRKKEELHRKFVTKLGHPDSMSRFRTLDKEDAVAAEGDDAEDQEEDEAPAPTRGKKKGSKTGKLTPMELQFLDIKRKHMDTVLIVEVGYKFRFFGEDARIAAKELSIVCIPGKFRYDEHPSEAHLDRFASASIPVHRLPVHAKRLVAAGHKVGVVRQLETAALKKAGDNRNAPFVRKLTNIYTKGTYIDENGDLESAPSGDTPSGGHLLCITETVAGGTGTDENVKVGILAVQPATGDIIYDEFDDGFMRREIETRLLHISPCEFLIVGDLTKATDKLIQHLSRSRTNVFGDRSRVERVPKSRTMAAEATSSVTQFYAGKAKPDDERSAALLEKVLKLPDSVTICLSAMITHLTEYGLQHIFDLTKYFQSFSTRQHMLINGTTLESLEVYRNATDHTEKGSLFWALNKTQTRFGQRLLRKWIGRPLLDQEALQERVSAVEELLENQSTAKVEKLQSLLAATRTDLERSLIRIYYGKCTRPELLATLQVLQKIATEYSHIRSPADTGFKSRPVSEAICALPAIRDTVIAHLEKINPVAARKDDKYEFFRNEEDYEDIENRKLGIAAVEQDLDAHRTAAAEKLGKKTPVSYVTVAGIDYLIEVNNTDLKHVPASWAKISGTKKLSRFHTPEVVTLINERDQHREALAAACDTAFVELLQAIAADYQPLRDAVVALATLDCLLSLAKVAALPGYSKPEFLPADAPTAITIQEGRHPIAEHTLPNGYIPFTTSLGAPAPLAQLITGPNMGGKSSYVRAVALLVLLAQIGSFVPATAMRLTLRDAIFTRMGARDNLFAGESTFMVEVSETAAILRSATPRSLVVLDELGRGTSTHDGAAIAHAVLEHMVREVRCLTLFITHYQNLARVADGLGGGLVKCVHMRFTATKAGQPPEPVVDMQDTDGTGAADEQADADPDDEITFLYEVGDGVAHRSYGLNVARLARIPRKVLEVAGRKSRELEHELTTRRLLSAVHLMSDVLQNGPSQLDSLVSSIEQL